MSNGLQVVYRATSELKPNPANARLHSEEQIKQISNSIKEFGFTNPILTDENDMVIAGHGRLAAALKIGFDKVPVIQLKNLSQTQLRALMIADNKIALNATWDYDLLASEMVNLIDEDVKFTELGFTAGDIESIERIFKRNNRDDDAESNLPDDDDHDAQETPQAKPDSNNEFKQPKPIHHLDLSDERGTIWCGDSAEVLNLFKAETVDMILTSPPYDNLRDYNGYSFDFEKISQHLVRVLKTNGVLVWIVKDSTINGDQTGTSFRQALHFKNIGLKLHDTMIWQKQGFPSPGSENRYKNVFEYMFVFCKGKITTFNPLKDIPTIHAHKVSNKTPLNRQIDGSTTRGSILIKPTEQYKIRSNIWTVNQILTKSTRFGHPAPFPLALARDHIATWSNPSHTVLDPFMGSGTTGVVALETGRRFVGIEISDEYFEICKKRLIPN